MPNSQIMPETKANTILHVDMDAFYAAVEQRDHPELRGKPVVVGGSAEGRGVVSTASYEARVFGIHSAMPAATAVRLCPHAIFLPVRMGHYVEVSRQIRHIFHSFTPRVEPLSLDEAFLDIHGCEGLFGSAVEIAVKIRAKIRAETGLTASVGVAPNKFLAKLASDLDKPDGLVVIEPNRVMEVLHPLPVKRLWGVGAKAEKRLKGLGLHTIGQIAEMPEQSLASHLGDVGRHLWRLAHGIDARSVVPEHEAKSVSTETTFARDIGDRDVLRTLLLELVEQLGYRLRQKHLRTRTVEVKARSSSFRTYTRSKTLSDPSDVTETIWEAASTLFDERILPAWMPLRLLGVGASGLVHDNVVQGDLFDSPRQSKQRSLDKTVDEIRNAFGRGAIRRAGGIREF